jgi:hypothetical protein
MRRRRVESDAEAAVLEALLDRGMLESPGLGVEAELLACDGAREERPRVEDAGRVLVDGDRALNASLEPADLVPVPERLLDEEQDGERMHLVVGLSREATMSCARTSACASPGRPAASAAVAP